jgi:ABC-2 type transport system permease protein
MLVPAFWVSKSLTELVGYGINQQFLFFQLILLLFAGTFLLFGGKRSLV